jgi:hypothetical protein
MTKPPDWRSMSADEIVDNLPLHIYEPPFLQLRDDLRSLPEVLRIPILLIDFDTEVCMNSILGFLENPTGRYFADTIAALERIAAHDTAAILRAIQKIVADHGVTHERLRADHAHMQEWQITTFRQRHGEEVSQMARPIDEESKKLYIYDNPHNRERESVFDLLSAYIEQQKDELVAALEAQP